MSDGVQILPTGMSRKNVLLHVRSNDRTNPEVKGALYIWEDVPSDWQISTRGAKRLSKPQSQAERNGKRYLKKEERAISDERYA